MKNVSSGAWRWLGTAHAKIFIIVCELRQKVSIEISYIIISYHMHINKLTLSYRVEKITAALDQCRITVII